MKFPKKFQAILEKLGFVDKAKNKELSKEDWKQIEESFKETYSQDFYEAMNEDKEQAKKAKQYDAALAMLETPASENSNSEDAPKAQAPDLSTAIQSLNDKATTLAAENATLKAQNETLAAQAAPDAPETVTANLNISGGRHTATHLFGYEHDMYAMSHRWNQITANTSVNLPEASRSDSAAFFGAYEKYKEQFAARMNQLHAEGSLNLEALSQIDYSQLKDAGLGEQFVIRRMDALIARIMKLPSVEHIFPTRYGVQDKELLTNAFFGEFSQAYQKGEVFKGSYKLQPEMAHVDDAMIKVLFESMKWIERQYIGYLNTSGSDPIKWNMIEWLLLNIATVATNEKNGRSLLGHRVEPEEGVPGHYLHASTGVLHRLISYVEDFKVLPFEEGLYQNYDATTILEAVESFVRKAQEYYTSFVGKALYLNINYRQDYAAAYRKKYGVQMDFTSTKTEIQDVDDLEIIWVPNMGKVKFLWLTDKGNMQGLELLPGEMHKTGVETRMETVLVWSVWKEGKGASFAGQKFDTKEELLANDFENQAILCSNPVLPLEADATTFDASFGLVFETAENTKATALTDIAVKSGVVIKLQCGSITNATTIAKTGKFSELSSAWNPSKVGNWIKLYYKPKAKKFVEVARG